jgi:hypothetical protein
MLSIAEVDRQRAMDMCIGIADKVLLTSAVLPAMLSRFPFHDVDQRLLVIFLKLEKGQRDTQVTAREVLYLTLKQLLKPFEFISPTVDWSCDTFVHVREQARGLTK